MSYIFEFYVVTSKQQNPANSGAFKTAKSRLRALFRDLFCLNLVLEI